MSVQCVAGSEFPFSCLSTLERLSSLVVIKFAEHFMVVLWDVVFRTYVISSCLAQGRFYMFELYLALYVVLLLTSE